MKFKLLLSGLFMLSIFYFSTAFTLKHDSLPSQNPEYKGYRLAMTSIKTEQMKDNWLKIEYTAINTGREDLLFGNGMAPPPSLVLNIDEQYDNLDLERFKEQISNSILTSELTVRAGSMVQNQEVKIKLNNLEFKPQEVDVAANTEGNNADNTTTKGIEKEAYDPDACSDLIIESVTVIKKTKKAITLKYKITNNGVGPAYLSANSKESSQILAIKAHMSSSENLTRGALPLGGAFITNNKGKVLAPGQSITEEIRLDIRSMTKFTPVIILELDPYLSIRECDETNNLNHIKVD